MHAEHCLMRETLEVCHSPFLFLCLLHRPRRLEEEKSFRCLVQQIVCVLPPKFHRRASDADTMSFEWLFVHVSVVSQKNAFQMQTLLYNIVRTNGPQVRYNTLIYIQELRLSRGLLFYRLSRDLSTSRGRFGLKISLMPAATRSFCLWKRRKKVWADSGCKKQ